MISRLILAAVILLISTSAHAIDVGVGFGPFLPSRIGSGVREVMNGWASRVGFKLAEGAFEIEYYNARGSGLFYHTVALDLRVDANTDGVFADVPAFMILGVHADTFSTNKQNEIRTSGGWQYGAGVRVPMFGKESGVALRADFKHRFGPGNSLIVLVGFSFLTGS